MPVEHRRTAWRALRATVAWLLVVLSVAAGLGWLYLLSKLHAFDFGPRQSGALPLEELASQGSQPLGRMVVAWLPAGAAATLALTWVARVSTAWAPVGVALVAAPTLYLTTAGSEALTHNEPFGDHLGPALEQSGLWSALVLIVLGSLLAAAAARVGRRGRGTAASGALARGRGAA
jgi:hypothetical protein